MREDDAVEVQQVGLAGTEAGAGTPVPAFRIESLSKTYPGILALRAVDLTIQEGEIRGLCGENGSGKSTLAKILSGAAGPDPGANIEFFGSPLPVGDTAAARNLGIFIVHQELTMFPMLTALENVFAGDHPTHGRLWVARREMLREFRALVDDLELEVNPFALAGELSVADQTMLEIMRAVRTRVRFLILDEPTASLGPVEREQLYKLVRQLHRQRGVSFIYISHDLDEVLDITTSVTVFRDGEHIRSAPVAEWSKRSLVQAMLGEEASSRIARALEEPAEQQTLSAVTLAPRHEQLGTVTEEVPTADGSHERKPLLRVSGVTVPGALDEVELTAFPGEIVGIAGLVGAGRSMLLRAIAGAHKVTPGASFELNGKLRRWPTSVAVALKLGIALLPEERKTEGLILGMSVADNVVASDYNRVARSGVVSNRRARTRARELLHRVGFRGFVEQSARTLSGGNQQKVLLAKWLHRPTRIFLLDEPTRGIDVGAKAEVLATMRKLAAEGAAIVFVSSEFEEIVAASDRVVFLSRGRNVGEVTGTEITRSTILTRLFEVEVAAADADAAVVDASGKGNSRHD